LNLVVSFFLLEFASSIEGEISLFIPGLDGPFFHGAGAQENQTSVIGWMAHHVAFFVVDFLFINSTGQ
jgi:hypothetical protein